MEAYEKEMYNFFTCEDNFISMCKVAKNYPVVTSQLKEEFWALVQEKLKQVLQSNNSNYAIKITGRITDERTKIMLYKNDWPVENNQPVVAIAIQRLAANSFPFYGPWINNDSKRMDLKSMNAQCLNSQAAVGFDKDDAPWFPFFKDVDVDFKNDEEYVKILPDKRDSFAEMVAAQVYQLAKIMEEDMDKLAKMTK